MTSRTVCSHLETRLRLPGDHDEVAGDAHLAAAPTIRVRQFLEPLDPEPGRQERLHYGADRPRVEVAVVPVEHLVEAGGDRMLVVRDQDTSPPQRSSDSPG